jgi:hypothetical protein
MATYILKTKTDIEDFVRGCAFFGTGGGGDPKDGLNQLLYQFEVGKEIKWKDISEIPDNILTVCAYGMGSIAPQTLKQRIEMKSLGLIKEKIKDKLGAAIKELEKYTGEKIEAVVPVEIGGANTPAPVATAANLDLSVVDGDYSGGRAIPELVQTTPHLNGYSMVPLASVDQWNNVCIIKDVVNNMVAEKLGKFISILAYGKLAGNATYLIQAEEMKKIVIPNTLTRAFELGKAIRKSRESGKDLIETIVEYTKGWMLFKGKVVKKEDKDMEGYYWGTITLEGVDEFRENTFRWWFKNENHISWLNDRPFVTSPDVISVVDLKTGEPITNPRVKVGDVVAGIGVKGSEVFKTKKGLSVLGPKHFGFDIQYTPIEEIMKKKGIKVGSN